MNSVTGGWKRTAIFGGTYCALIAATIACYELVRLQGEKFSLAKALAAEVAPVAMHSQGMLSILLAFATVIVAGKTCGILVRLIGQPAVVGEILAGIALGPSLIGSLWPDISHQLIAADTVPVLSALAQLGIVLYMFQMGLEFSHSDLKREGKDVALISHAGIAVPFLLGAVLSLWLFPRFGGAGVSFTAFSLFIGIAMSITAFPVLARILSDQNISQTRLGRVAMACAALDDVTAWCLLAALICFLQAKQEYVLSTLFMAIGFIAFMVVMVRPGIKVLAGLPVNQSMAALILVLVLISSITTESIGIHAIFGAFLLGAIIPADSRWAAEFEMRFKTVIRSLLLPAFFVVVGLKTDLRLLLGLDQWLACGLIIGVAVVGKFGGALFASRLNKQLTLRESVALGALMNARGLVELIVLDIGLRLGVISATVFSMMVLMAVVTTLMATPIVRLAMPELVRRPARAELHYIVSP